MAEVVPKQDAPEAMPDEEIELDSLHATANLNLVKVEVVAAEDLEEEVLSERAALYRFSDEEKDWKERARGDIKILKLKDSGKYRLLMRAEKTLKVRLNHLVGDVTLQPNAGSDKAWNWRWQDFATDSGEPEVHSFAVRFRTKEIADSFNAMWETARAANKASTPAAPAVEAKKEEAPAATEEKPAEEAKTE
jgi:hypothetical protein